MVKLNTINSTIWSLNLPKVPVKSHHSLPGCEKLIFLSVLLPEHSENARTCPLQSRHQAGRGVPGTSAPSGQVFLIIKSPWRPQQSIDGTVYAGANVLPFGATMLFDFLLCFVIFNLKVEEKIEKFSSHLVHLTTRTGLRF